MFEYLKVRITYKWFMLLGVWFAYFAFGIVQGGIPPIIGPVSSDLDLSRSSMGTILGAWPLVYIVTAIPAGALIDRFNLKYTIGIGIFLIAVSGLSRVFADNYFTMVLSVMIFGIGGPFISIGAPKLISLWFPENLRGRAMGIYLTAPAFGRVLVLSITNSVLMPLFNSNWRLTLLVYALVAFFITFIWLILSRDNDCNQNDIESKNLFKSMKTFPELISTSQVRMILFIVLGMFLFNHGTNNWIPEILIDLGNTESAAGFLSAIPVVTGALGSIVLPQYIKKQNYQIVLLICFFVAGLSTLGVLFFDDLFLYLILAILGFTSRSIMPIIMLILISVVGSKKTGAAGGLYFTSGEIGGVLGPVLLGVSADVFNGFNVGLFLFSAICFLLGVFSLKINYMKIPSD